MVFHVMVASMVVGSAAGIAIAGSGVRYLDFPASDFRLAVALGSASCLVCGAVLVRSLGEALAPILGWSDENRTAERAGVVWRAAIRLPGLIAFRGALASPVALLMMVVPFFALNGHSLDAALGFALAGAATAGPALTTVVFATDLALRPLLRDVATFLPEEFEPALEGWRLRTKVLAPLPFLTLYSALAVGAFADLVARGPGRLALALAIAFAAMSVVGVLFWVATRVLLDPVDDLLAATVRVRAGDVATPVPVVTSDELGGLAHGFNRMLASLRSHQQQAAAAETVRRQLERDIHDGAQQRLAAIGMWLDGLQNLLTDDAAPEARAIAHRASEELRDAIDDLRRLSHGLPPPTLAEHGFDVAVRELVARTPGATMHGHAGEAVAPAVAVAAYFAVTEALTNALRHSGASAIEVGLTRRVGILRIEVRDDGCGGATLDGGTGLRGLSRRLAEHDGTLRVDSPIGAGTLIGIELPVDGSTRPVAAA